MVLSISCFPWTDLFWGWGLHSQQEIQSAYFKPHQRKSKLNILFGTITWIWHETASDGEMSVQELWRSWSMASLPLLPGTLRLGVVIHIWASSVWKFFFLFFFFFFFFELIHTSINRWSFTGVWVIASLLKSPELFSVFWPILTVLSFGWSPLVLLFSVLPVHLLLVLWLLRAHQLQLVSPSLSCSVGVQFPSKV